MIDPKLLDEYYLIKQLRAKVFNRSEDGKIISRILEKLLDRAYPAFINYFDFTSGSQTTFTESNQFKKLVATTTSLFDWETFEHTNNRITNTGYEKNVKMEGIISISAQNNEELHAAFFKNGEIIPCSEQSGVASSGGKTSAIPFQCIATMNPGDYIEVWVKNSTSSHQITLGNINVIVTEL